MEITLKVVEGAKTGTKIAVKKSTFLIGRSQKCHLCAGSNSISRKHCAITRKDDKVTIQDLGSRNGTYVNENRIAEEVELSSGDELRIGPLRFLVTISPGIKNLKRSEVQSVADAADRTAEGSSVDVQEDDITSWLLASDADARGNTETQTMRMDDTNAVRIQEQEEEPAKHSEADGDVSQEEEGLEEESSDDSKSGGKKKPGRLPPVPEKPMSKDSREAAADALRAWSRRR